MEEENKPMKKLILTGLILVSPLAVAQKAWHGEGDLAYNLTTGNSDSETLLAKLQLVYERGRWTHTGQFEAVNTSEDDSRSAEAYILREQSDFAISESTYAFGGFRYEDNRFSGYEYQASVKTGLGKHLIDDGVTEFDIEGGLGYRRSEEQDTGETFNEVIAIAAAKYHRQLTETTRFESDFLSESGQDNAYLELVLGVKVKINASLALKVGYTVKHNTDVPADREKTDTLTSVGLNYSF